MEKLTLVNQYHKTLSFDLQDWRPIVFKPNDPQDVELDFAQVLLDNHWIEEYKKKATISFKPKYRSAKHK